MAILFSLLSGLLFGLGLIVSGMANPAKVIGFLDITRVWDPSLAFVMGGAISVGFFAFRAAFRRAAPWYGEKMHLPTARQIDKRLIGGSLIFGVGWGLAGICPGPGLVLLGMGAVKGWLFVAAMIIGMLIFEGLEKRKSR
ncbi:YeeE/YedE family protein [Martelella alba]|uniref:YeeE/YedE family protein n=1 Tax=Martelella alba TaxID=2590451 RepID=A0ABY2SPA4_9HYPH|nr:YeeE/YedE family protein [Martelella alba]TKI06488.1 YeeE/YedE family protein [Martelella alba]